MDRVEQLKEQWRVENPQRYAELQALRSAKKPCERCGGYMMHPRRRPDVFDLPPQTIWVCQECGYHAY